MAQYRVIANVHTTTPDGFASTRTLPTFILDSRIQGIVDADHAAGIARDVVDPYHILHVSVTTQNVDVYADGHTETFQPKFGGA